MAEKVELEETELPPNCPHCTTALRRVHWHKIRGGPGLVNYIALLSCPHCRALLGALGS
jgi:hypothetical protein